MLTLDLADVRAVRDDDLLAVRPDLRLEVRHDGCVSQSRIGGSPSARGDDASDLLRNTRRNSSYERLDTMRLADAEEASIGEGSLFVYSTTALGSALRRGPESAERGECLNEPDARAARAATSAPDASRPPRRLSEWGLGAGCGPAHSPISDVVQGLAPRLASLRATGVAHSLHHARSSRRSRQVSCTRGRANSIRIAPEMLRCRASLPPVAIGMDGAVR